MKTTKLKLAVSVVKWFVFRISLKIILNHHATGKHLNFNTMSVCQFRVTAKDINKQINWICWRWCFLQRETTGRFPLHIKTEAIEYIKNRKMKEVLGFNFILLGWRVWECFLCYLTIITVTARKQDLHLRSYKIKLVTVLTPYSLTSRIMLVFIKCRM